MYTAISEEDSPRGRRILSSVCGPSTLLLLQCGNFTPCNGCQLYEWVGVSREGATASRRRKLSQFGNCFLEAHYGPYSGTRSFVLLHVRRDRGQRRHG